MDPDQERFAQQISAMLACWPVASDIPLAWRERVYQQCREAIGDQDAVDRLAKLLGVNAAHACVWLLALSDAAEHEPSLEPSFRSRLWVLMCAWGQPPVVAVPRMLLPA